MRCLHAIVLTCLLAFHCVDGFQSIMRPAAIRFQQRGSLQNSNEEEIANLEEQLKKLKDKTSSETPATGESMESEEPEEPISIELFLSEKWKEEDAPESSEGGGLTGVLAAVGLALFLAVFSQVPVGREDLSKYSAIKAPTTTLDLGDLNRVRQSGDL
jgi:hypothetical protein